jgi:hypothetical protein
VNLTVTVALSRRDLAAIAEALARGDDLTVAVVCQETSDVVALSAEVPDDRL